MTPQELEELRQRSILQEYRFESQAPLIGPLIVRFRSAWHSIAGKWAIRSIVQQQSVFNQQMVMSLECLAMSDQDLVKLTHTVAELTHQVIQLQRAVASLQADRATAPTVRQTDADA